VVALHGCTQTAGDFAAGSRFDSVAERAGAYVVYPEQPVRANGNRCWNWFLAAHQARGQGEPGTIVSLVNDLLARHPIDPQRVYVAGLSAGGAMAAILAEQAPDVFAAAGIMAGVPLHASRNVEDAFRTMRAGVSPADAVALLAGRRLPEESYERLRVTIWTGTEDRTVNPRNAPALTAQFRSLCGVADVEASIDARKEATIERWRGADGRVRVEAWQLPRIGHAWSGGSFRGSHTDPNGPSASDAMMAFFLDDGGVAAAAPAPTGLPNALRRSTER
jgi:poly(hydroxyalkanoate) depolymerase family esterase